MFLVKTNPHSTVKLLPDYGSEEKEAEAEMAIDPMVRSDETKSVHATRAIPAHQTMKAPALRTQPKFLATTVRFEESFTGERYGCPSGVIFKGTSSPNANAR